MRLVRPCSSSLGAAPAYLGGGELSWRCHPVEKRGLGRVIEDERV